MIIPENLAGKVISFSFRHSPSPAAVLTTAKAGDMGRNTCDAAQNSSRRIIFEALGIGPPVTIRQEHTRIVHDTRYPGIVSAAGDGLITMEGKTLAVTVADCVPVFLLDSKTGAYGIVHSGWKGTGIALEAVKRMCRLYGTSPGRIEAIIGPSIGKCCYSVSSERAQEFSSEWGSENVGFDGQKHYLDLKMANRKLLLDGGVGMVTVSDECTCCGHGFHSYRRDGAQHFGLMLALIGYFG